MKIVLAKLQYLIDTYILNDISLDYVLCLFLNN